MTFTKISSALISCSLLFSFSLFAEDAPATELEPVTKNAELLNFAKPNFPEELRAAGSEGWVKFNYIVGTDGKAKNILIESSLGNKAFEAAALEALNNFEHAPAVYKNKNVEQVVSELVLDFTLPQTTQGVDDVFNTTYLEIIDLLSKKDVETGEAKLNTLAASNNLTIAELAQIEVLRSQIASSKGDRFAQLIHQRKAMVGNGQYLPKALYANVLSSHFASAVTLSLFNEAFNSYNQFEATTPDDPMVTRFALTMAPLQKSLESDKPVRVIGQIGERGHWTYTPLRRNFSFKVAEEGITEFEPRCDRRNKRFEVNTTSEWRIPESWGFCTVAVYGKPGAKFALMEFQPPEEEE